MNIENNQKDDTDDTIRNDKAQRLSILVEAQLENSETPVDLVGTQPEEPLELMIVVVEQKKETEDTETMSKEEQSTPNTIVPIEHFPENTLEV